ncbi:uncharacterized protein LOC128982793 [Macrosteles quadrilineatus]|uniref:uncharacterized protein LOC128982793 n=1 Tax=Macrosteles quadrilineatus TaxID=74068 RepID=UPI0023E177DF|nr:uncharacterized protein LOC128982793 [Macrosteles quadrilineatus]
MWHYRSMKSHLKRSPALLVKKIGLRRTKRLITCRRALMRKRKEVRHKSTVSRKDEKEMSGAKDYGSFCQRLDLDDDEFEAEKSDLLKSLALNDEEKALVEVATRGQRENSRWLEERKVRLTASNFGLICKRRSKSLWAPVVKQLLYNKISTDAMMYGELNESAAIQCFEDKLNTKVLPCGLFVDKAIDFLAASPDGVVGEEDIVEVKCPKSAELLTIPEAVKQIKSFCLAPCKSSNDIKLKRNHNYYYQVQGQLHISNKRRCYFVVWTKKDIHIEAIERDDKFWKEKMEKPLCFFYKCALLPEIVDPRTCRSMPIREPNISLPEFKLDEH